MQMKALMLAAALAAGAALVPHIASANALPPAKAAQSLAVQDSLVQAASRRCWAWRKECAARWGWGGWRFRRCLARHDC